MTGSNKAGESRTRSGLLLQDRDRRLLAETAAMRMMDRELAQLAGGFGCVRRTNARLLKLTRGGFLNRFFVGSTASGRKAIYTLSKKGAGLVASPHRLLRRRFGQTVVGDLFVDHQLRINQIYVALRFRPLPANIGLLAWRDFPKPLSPATALVPDGYFELRTPAGVRAHFLEVDLGTEGRPPWERKIRGYIHLALSGEFSRIFRQPQFRVLVLTTSEKRLANIRSVIAKHTDKVFYLTTFEPINSSGLWSPIWLRPTGDQRQSLI